MDYITADSRQWAFTLRRTSRPKQVTCDQYISHVQKFVNKLNCKLESYVFEEKGGLHMHGILDIPKTVDKKRFRVRGWHWYMEELYNYAGWRQYMLKEQHIVEDEYDDNTSTSLDSLAEPITSARNHTKSLRDEIFMILDADYGIRRCYGLKPVIVTSYISTVHAQTREIEEGKEI